VIDNYNQIKEKIARLKEELKAVIVAHNYQRPEVQATLIPQPKLKPKVTFAAPRLTGLR